MDPLYWVILLGAVIAAFALGAAVAWLAMRRRQERRLRERYGPEYDFVVEKTGRKHRAERELIRREERVRQYPIHPLSNEQRTRYADAWRRVQAQFVDAPAAALAEADRLVMGVIKERGYPADDFEQRAADLSVDHPRVVKNYREAHALVLRSERGEADTEDLRQAMVHFRVLFEDLLESPLTMDGADAPIGTNGESQRKQKQEYHEERNL